MSTQLQLFNPEKTALLVIDKQRAYMDPEVLAWRSKSLSEDALRRFERLEHLIEMARESDVQVLWTLMTESLSHSPAPIVEKMQLDVKTGGTVVDCYPGNESYDFYGDIKPLDSEAVLAKSRYDSFSNPELLRTLQTSGLSSVVLAGGFASRCVLATAFGANSHDIRVLVASDATINPYEYETEMQVSAGIIDAVLGYHATSQQIVDNWMV